MIEPLYIRITALYRIRWERITTSTRVSVLQLCLLHTRGLSVGVVCACAIIVVPVALLVLSIIVVVRVAAIWA